ncbi:hypothetical protein DP939_00580 [Spongiactinospora rosea]|uniref:Uncharacterized protein n=1 Tax=Spongiactinospora rosea TaxID=2248750 RepID=A0A366M4Z6_9ACTN|nr:hypothetical protein DP939_00580 [Spongiactinospora rosea]
MSQPGTRAPPSAVGSGSGGSPHPAPGAPARWPAEIVSQPDTGQVIARLGGGMVRVDSDPTAPSAASLHRLGVVFWSMSAHSRPGTPITATGTGIGPVAAAAAPGTVRTNSAASAASRAAARGERSGPYAVPASGRCM